MNVRTVKPEEIAAAIRANVASIRGLKVIPQAFHDEQKRLWGIAHRRGTRFNDKVCAAMMADVIV